MLGSSVVDLIPTGLHTSLLLRGSLILLVKDLHLSSQTLKTSNGTPLLVWVRPCSAVLLSRLSTLVEDPRLRLHLRRPLEPLHLLNRPAVRRRPVRLLNLPRRNPLDPRQSRTCVTCLVRRAMVRSQMLSLLRHRIFRNLCRNKMLRLTGLKGKTRKPGTTGTGKGPDDR